MAHRVVSLVTLLAGPLVASCAGHRVAEEGRRSIVGMDAETVQACAGIPTRTKQIDSRTEIFSYEIKNENRGGVEVTLPIIGGGVKLGASGSYCHAIMRVVDGKVAELNYTGDNDDVVGREGVCAPIVRGCLRAHGSDPEVTTAQARK